MNTQIETKYARQLVLDAIDVVETFVEDKGDWEASVVALLARALEEASGRNLKELYEIFE